MRRKWFTVILTITIVSIMSGVQAADWPQWLGPDRNGKSQETGWDKTLSRTEPLWQLTGNVPMSRSTPSIVGNRCYIFGDVRGQGPCLSAYDVKTGDLIWQKFYTPSVKKINTHASPTVDNGWVYTYDSSGQLRCWNAETGDLRWKRDLNEERGAFTNWHGMTCSPLIHSGKVYVAFMRLLEDEAEREAFLATKPQHYRMPGWKPQGAPEVHAFDIETGESLWMNDTDGTGKFPSMVAGIVDGKDTIVVNTSCGAAGLDPETGEALWVYDSFKSNEKQKESRTTFSSPSTPSIIDEHHVLFRQVYGNPICLKISEGVAEPAWDRNKMLTREEGKKEKPIYYHTSILFNDMVLVPLHGEKSNRSSLLALDVVSGEKLWRKDEIGGGHKLGGCFIVVDGVALFRSGNKIVSLEINRSGAEVLGELAPPGESPQNGYPHSSLPVLANGKLFVQSSGYGFATLSCFDVSESSN